METDCQLQHPAAAYSTRALPVQRQLYAYANNRAATGMGFADFDLGILSNALVSSFINDTFQQPGYFFYVQDDFKVTTNVTVNIGLRYEFISQPLERRDGQANFNLATGALDIPKDATILCQPASFPNPSEPQRSATACPAGSK